MQKDHDGFDFAWEKAEVVAIAQSDEDELVDGERFRQSRNFDEEITCSQIDRDFKIIFSPKGMPTARPNFWTSRNSNLGRTQTVNATKLIKPNIIPFLNPKLKLLISSAD